MKKRYMVEISFRPGAHHEVTVDAIDERGWRTPITGHGDSTDSLSLYDLLRPALRELQNSALESMRLERGARR